MGHHGNLEYRFDASSAYLPDHHFPELEAIVALDAAGPKDSREDSCAALDTAPSCLAQGVARSETVWIAMFGVMRVTPVETPRLVDVGDHTPPVGCDLLVGHEEVDI
jgi:hypothetical protein